MLPEPNKAEIITDSYKPIKGERIYFKERLFKDSEAEHVNVIIKELEGMDITSAHDLLERIKQYLMLITI